MTWTNAKPSEHDVLSEVGTFLRSQKSAIQTALEKHFYWTDSSGASGGVPRLSDATGSARAFSGTSSALSSSSTPGMLMVTTAEKYLYAISDVTGHALLGGPSVIISQDSTQPTASNWRWLVQSGSTDQTAVVVTFPTAYDVTPVIQVQGVWPSTTTPFDVKISTPSGSTFRLDVTDATGGGASITNVYWRSVGTVALP